MPSNFPKTISLGNSGTKEFLSQNELNGYLGNEAQNWSELLSNIPSHYLVERSPNASLLASIVSNPTNYKPTLELLQSNVIFTSDSVYWAELISLRSKNRDYVLPFLHAFQERYSEYSVFSDDHIPVTASFSSALSAAYRFFDAVEQSRRQDNELLRLQSVTNQLELRATEALDHLNSATNTTKAWGEKASEYEKKLNEAVENATGLTLTHFARLKNELEEVREEAKGSLKNLEKSLKEDALIEVTSEYWLNKSKKHHKRYTILSGAAAGYAIISLAGIFWGATQLPAWLNFHSPSHNPSTDAQTDAWQYYTIFVAIALLTIIFWVMRVLLRTMFSEQHLSTDADEKRVFSQSYLALIKEGSATKEERILMLTSLFKSASDGIVKEDGSSEIGVAAIASKLLMPGPK